MAVEIDKLMDEVDESLIDEEYEKKCRLKELVENGYYDPFRIDQSDIASLMKSYGILSEEDAYMHNFTEDDKKRLADVLENNWHNLDEYSKVVYHVIKNASFHLLAKTVSSNTGVFEGHGGISKNGS